jgi:hypothetical protein
MFRCQFSGEVSDPAIFKTVTYNERLEDGRWVSKTKRVFVSGVEKPVKIVVETRPRSYTNYWYDDEGVKHAFETQGTEIVRELMVRPKHLEAVKAKYKLT